MNATMQEIKQLSVAERIQLVEDIWDSIAAESLELTENQRAELDNRLESHRADFAGSSWEEVKSRLQNW